MVTILAGSDGNESGYDGESDDSSLGDEGNDSRPPSKGRNAFGSQDGFFV